MHHLERRDRGVTVSHSRGQTRAARVIVCAGAWSDRLAAPPGRRPTRESSRSAAPTCGLRPEARSLVRGLIYPVPDPGLPFLGVHLTKRIDGEVLLGPTALLVGARDAYRAVDRDASGICGRRSAGPGPGG